MKSFLIRENDAGQRLDKFLQKALPRLPQSLMYKYLRIKRIKVNGKRSEISFRLSVGDEVQLYINDEFFTSAPSSRAFLLAPAVLDVVYEDENILLVNKKPGLCVHEDNDGASDTLISRILHYLYEKEEYDPDKEHSFVPALANRIDRNTSGIVIAAKKAEALRVLNEKIKEREVEKSYLCGVAGHLKPEHAMLTAYLLRRENESLVQVFDHPVEGARTIVTEYSVLETSPRNSLLEVRLHTGRTHQIRAHMAHIGHPLLGDGKYGESRYNREYKLKWQLLCSYKLKFAFQTPAGCLSYLQDREFEVKDVWFRDNFHEKF